MSLYVLRPYDPCPNLIMNLLTLGKSTVIRVRIEAQTETAERIRNQNHSTRKILSLMMFRLRTHMAWSTLRLPVKAPDGNWQLLWEMLLKS